MNITEFVYLTHDIIRYHLFKETPVYHFITAVSSFTAKLTWRLFIKLLVVVWILIKDVTQLGLVFLCIGLFYLLFSFISSLKPRYRFTNHTNKDEFKPPQYYCIMCEEKPKEPSWIRRMMMRLRKEYVKVDRECSCALNVDDIQDVYKQLSWSQTQIDFESVNWLNQTLQTFWPSIKTLLDKFVIKDLLKPKAHSYSIESKSLTSAQPKLSVFISARRKLELLQKGNTNWLSRSKRYIDQSAIAILIFFFKIFFIHFKQFIMDYIKYMISNSKSRQKEKQFNLNLKKFLIEKSSTKEKKVKKQDSEAPRTWGGFDLQSGRRKNSLESNNKRRKRKFKSAEPVSRVFFTKNGLTGPRSMARLRNQRLKLAAKFRNLQQDLFEKELTIEKIRLGDSIPTLNGVKYIEENSVCILSEVNKVSRHLAPSDNSNMKYVIELNYETDNKFCIELNSVPILNRVKLTKVGFRLRLLLNLNHTTCELNRDLEMLDTPSDMLWPAINYAQVALVDVPSLEWHLERPEVKPKSSKSRIRKKQGLLQRLMEKYGNYLNPVGLINHLYFKYLIHFALQLSLKWFQPFDVRIGKHLYLKSLC